MKQILYEELPSIWQIVDMSQSVETVLENISDWDDFLDKSMSMQWCHQKLDSLWDY